MVFEYLQLLHLLQGVGLSSAAREMQRDIKKGKHFSLPLRSEKCDSNTHFADKKLDLKKCKNLLTCKNMFNNKLEVELDQGHLTQLDRWLWPSSRQPFILCYSVEP